MSDKMSRRSGRGARRRAGKWGDELIDEDGNTPSLPGAGSVQLIRAEEHQLHAASSSLFLFNLPFDIDEAGVAELFQEFGCAGPPVLQYRRRKFSGRATLEMSSPEEALHAIAAVHGRLVNGRPVSVCIARSSPGQNTEEDIRQRVQAFALGKPHGILKVETTCSQIRHMWHKQAMEAHLQSRSTFQHRKGENSEGESDVVVVTLRIPLTKLRRDHSRGQSNELNQRGAREDKQEALGWSSEQPSNGREHEWGETHVAESEPPPALGEFRPARPVLPLFAPPEGASRDCRALVGTPIGSRAGDANDSSLITPGGNSNPSGTLSPGGMADVHVDVDVWGHAGAAWGEPNGGSGSGGQTAPTSISNIWAYNGPAQ
jgi:RNA recognition motif-containing protein